MSTKSPWVGMEGFLEETTPKLTLNSGAGVCYCTGLGSAEGEGMCLTAI